MAQWLERGVAKKWNESGFRPPLCTYRLNWARRTWGWWDDWDDTVLQTQDSKFEAWRSEAEHATSRSRRHPTILTFTRGWGRNIFVSFKPPRPGTEPWTLAWKAAVLTTTLGPMSLPAVGFRTQLGAGFSEKYHVSPLPILRLCFHVVSSGNVHFTLKCFTWLSWHWPYVGSMSDQSLRRWPNIEPIEGQHLVSLGMADNSKITKFANWQ